METIRSHDEPREALEGALYEIKQVIIGQDAMLERVMVALLTGGHVLLEGVPGLAKTLTIKTLASVVGGSFRRIQFTPDLVPSDLVGTRIYRPDSGTFDTELGPVFANFLLADEINRAPAKVQSALLEVMQEEQVTIGGDTHGVPLPFLVLATQNPIESEGTYPLPEAQVDRFLMKILVDYPAPGDEAAVVESSLAPAAVPRAGARRVRRPRGDRVRRCAGRRHAPPRAARAQRRAAALELRRQSPRPDRSRTVGAIARAAPRPSPRSR
jgi:MoxR-like ATPase